MRGRFSAGPRALAISLCYPEAGEERHNTYPSRKGAGGAGGMLSLAQFYKSEPGAARPVNEDGEPQRWRHVPSVRERSAKILAGASSGWDNVDWSNIATLESLYQATSCDALLNPLRAMDEHLDQPPPSGAVLRSRVHGDLNLSNVLVWE